MSTTATSEKSYVISLAASARRSNRYEYLPLPGEGWVRTLELHSGSGALSCTLRSQSITDAASTFEALSYVWGADALTNRTDIACDGSKLTIGPNLACALRYIREESRHLGRSRMLWVDAVCINQEDKNERSKQVQQMGDIYASAQKVLIWMGEDRLSQADACFALIQDTNAFLSSLLAMHGNVADIPLVSPGSRNICSDQSKWDLVRLLMDKEWFSRVWVLQEVGLARAAIIQWGKSAMAWSQLVELMLFVAWRPDVATHTGNVRSGKIYDVFEDVWRGFGNKDTWRSELPLTRSMNHIPDGQTLIDILNDGRTYQATDQRDRIYAFLSHPKAASRGRGEASAVIADYNKSVDEVYIDTAMHLLKNDPYSWTVLSCIDHTLDSPSLSGERPSWVPRWDEGWRVYWLGYPGMWYRTGGAERTAFQVHISRQDLLIEIKGVLLDTITWISQSWIDEDLVLARQKDGAPLQALWEELQRDDSSTIYGHTHGEREHAYSLAIAAGRAADDGPAEDDPSFHKSVYQAYKELIRSEYTEMAASAEEVIPGEARPEYTLQLEALTYISNQRRALSNRRLFRTSRGYYGVGHRTLQIGDVCGVFRGANVPFILREVGSTNPGLNSTRYRLIGEAYIQGIMKGEVFEMVKESPSKDDCDAEEIKITVV